MEMNALEEQADNAKARELHWKPLSWLGTIRTTTPNDAWDQPLWETFVCTIDLYGAQWRNQSARLGGRSSGPSFPLSWTHGAYTNIK